MAVKRHLTEVDLLDINSDMSSLTQRILGVEQVEGGLQAWAAGVDAVVQDANGNVATLTSRMTAAEGVIATINGQVSTLLSRATTLETLTATHTSQIAAVNTALAGKAALSHTHLADDVLDATATGRSLMKAASAAAARAVIMAPQAFIADAATNAPNDAATNAPTDAPTNLNPVTTLLGALTGEVNATNQRQNTIAANVNANAAKQNTMANILRDVATKLNLTKQAEILNGLVAAA